MSNFLAGMTGGLLSAYAQKKMDDQRWERKEAMLNAQYGDKYIPPKPRDPTMLEKAGTKLKGWMDEWSKPAADPAPAATPAPEMLPQEMEPAPSAPAEDAAMPPQDAGPGMDALAPDASDELASMGEVEEGMPALADAAGGEYEQAWAQA